MWRTRVARVVAPAVAACAVVAVAASCVPATTGSHPTTTALPATTTTTTTRPSGGTTVVPAWHGELPSIDVDLPSRRVDVAPCTVTLDTGHQPIRIEHVAVSTPAVSGARGATVDVAGIEVTVPEQAITAESAQMNCLGFTVSSPFVLGLPATTVSVHGSLDLATGVLSLVPPTVAVSAQVVVQSIGLLPGTQAIGVPLPKVSLPIG
jgi:hypothetical protein